MNINDFFNQLDPGKKKPSQPKKKPVSTEFQLIEQKYDLPYSFGKQSISIPEQINSPFLEMISNSELEPILHIEEFLFFDTETTGLFTGAGNFPFLIGFLFFQNDQMVLRQYFAEDFSRIVPILNAIKELPNRFRYLVSYNGKSFDSSVMRNQFLLNRFPANPFDNLIHIDLLHITRRIWKNILTEFNLTSIERQVLGFTRVDDIPGAEVSENYFRFLKTKDRELIDPVIEHNKWDIIALASILVLLNEMFINYRFTFRQYYNVIDYCVRNRKHIFALELIDNLLKRTKEKRILQRLKTSKAVILKKRKEYDKARIILEEFETPYSLVELAKFYEHKKKDISKALSYCSKLLDHYRDKQEMEYYFSWTGTAAEDYDMLVKRIKRLKGKLKREKETSVAQSGDESQLQ